MNKQTTTSKIKLLSNGIVVNKLFTNSGFKEAYILEQGLELDFLCKGEEKPLLLDLSSIKSSTEDIRQMIDHNRFYSAKSIAVLLKSQIQKYLLILWCRIFKPQIPVNFFLRKKRAVNWLENYC